MTNIKIGNYRYRILALVFMATTINYFDRSLIGVMAPTLQKLFDWSNKDYAAIMVSFKIAYGIGLLFMGGIIDRLGTKTGYTISIVIWSIFGMLHAVIRPAFGLVGFILARFGLGLGESGNFPAAIKTVAEWFPKKDRAFATGIFDASTSVGAILAPFWRCHACNGVKRLVPLWGVFMGFRKLILGREARRNIGLVAIETPVGCCRDTLWHNRDALL